MILMTFFLSLEACKSQTQSNYKFIYFNNTPLEEFANAVEKQDTQRIKQIVEKVDDINYVESYFGNSVFLTAVANGKTESIKTLLKYSRLNLQLTNYSGKAAIHIAAGFRFGNEERMKMLKLLIGAGADVNQIMYGTESNKNVITTPLALAVDDISCGNLLLDNGADLYFKANNRFIVWCNSLNSDINANSLKFIQNVIVNQKKDIPLVLAKNVNGDALDIYHFLNSSIDNNIPEIAKVKQEILYYLKEINYPKKQQYKDTSYNHIR